LSSAALYIARTFVLFEPGEGLKETKCILTETKCRELQPPLLAGVDQDAGNSSSFDTSETLSMSLHCGALTPIRHLVF